MGIIMYYGTKATWTVLVFKSAVAQTVQWEEGITVVLVFCFFFPQILCHLVEAHLTGEAGAVSVKQDRQNGYPRGIGLWAPRGGLLGGSACKHDSPLPVTGAVRT